jgi:hypothetical protein
VRKREREILKLNALINIEPEKRFQNRRVVRKLRCSGDSISSSTESALRLLS